MGNHNDPSKEHHKPDWENLRVESKTVLDLLLWVTVLFLICLGILGTVGALTWLSYEVFQYAR